MAIYEGSPTLMAHLQSAALRGRPPRGLGPPAEGPPPPSWGPGPPAEGPRAPAQPWATAAAAAGEPGGGISKCIGLYALNIGSLCLEYRISMP